MRFIDGQAVHHLLDHLLARLKQCPPASGPACPLALARSVGGLVTTRDETRVWSAVQAHAAAARENDRAAIQAVLAASLHRLNPQIGDERFHELLGGLHEIRPALRSAPAAQLAQQIQILPSSSARAAALSQIL